MRLDHLFLLLRHNSLGDARRVPRLLRLYQFASLVWEDANECCAWPRLKTVRIVSAVHSLHSIIRTRVWHHGIAQTCNGSTANLVSRLLHYHVYALQHHDTLHRISLPGKLLDGLWPRLQRRREWRCQLQHYKTGGSSTLRTIDRHHEHNSSVEYLSAPLAQVLCPGTPTWPIVAARHTLAECRHWDVPDLCNLARYWLGLHHLLPRPRLFRHLRACCRRHETGASG